MYGPSEAERRRAQNRENLRAHYGLARANTSSSPLSESNKRLEPPREGRSEKNKDQGANADALDLGKMVLFFSIWLDRMAQTMNRLNFQTLPTFLPSSTMRISSRPLHCRT